MHITRIKQICTGAYLYIGKGIPKCAYMNLLPYSAAAVLYVAQYLIYYTVSFSVANIDG